MILLHAACLPDGLYLWGESPREPAVARARRRQPRRSPPLETSAARLSETVASVVPNLGSLGPAETLVAWLPTSDGLPLSSSPLIGPAPDSERTAQLSAWMVTAVPLTAEQVVLLLSSAADRATLAPGLVISRDLAFWTAVLRFAAGLVAHERFLPGIAPDAQRRTTLAAAMPGACRALSRSTQAPAPTSALEALDSVSALLLDHLVRSAGASRVWPHAPESAHDVWLRALFAPDDVVGGAPAELAALAAAVRDWRRPVALTSNR